MPVAVHALPLIVRNTMPNSAALPRSSLTRRIAADLMLAVWRYRNQTVAVPVADGGGEVVDRADAARAQACRGRTGAPMAHALFPVFLVLAYALLRFFGDALNEARDVVFSIVTQRTVAAFTERTFAHLHRMSARFHAGRETGAIVRDVQKGADAIGFLLGVALFTIVPTAFEIAAIVAIMVHKYTCEFMI